MPGAPLSLRKRLVFSAVITVGCFVLVELLLTAARSPVRTERVDPYVGFGGSLSLYEADADNPTLRTTAPNKRRWFNVQAFPASKAPDVRRVFCLGGSTTYGRPYDDRTSFCGWLRRFLAEAAPTERFEVINAGGISYASYRVARVLEEVADYEPDLIVLYTGHNEFLEDRTYGELRDRPAWIQLADEQLSRTRTYSGLHALISRSRGGFLGAELQGDVSTLLDQSVGLDAYSRDDAHRARVLEHFRFNLNRMVQRTRALGAELVLVVPASNLRNCSPFKSEGSVAGEAASSAAARAEHAFSVERSGNWTEAARELERALAEEPRRADWLYRLGSLRLAAGRNAAAEAALTAARDEDVCPLRAPTEFVAAVRETGQSEDVLTVDLPRRLRNWGFEIPGEDAFLDHVHPTPEVHARLANEILRRLRDRGWLTLDEAWDEPRALALQTTYVAEMDRSAHGKALRNLAKVLAWAGKDAEAARAAERSLDIDPEDAESLFILGTVAQARGRDEEALSFYERALAIEPQYVSARHNVGVVLAGRERWAEAETAYRATLALDADHPNARFNLARALVRQGFDEQAEDEYRTVLDDNPRDADAWFNLGRLLARTGRADAAARAFRRVLRIEPDAADVAYELEALRRN